MGSRSAVGWGRRRLVQSRSRQFAHRTLVARERTGRRIAIAIARHRRVARGALAAKRTEGVVLFAADLRAASMAAQRPPRRSLWYAPSECGKANKGNGNHFFHGIFVLL